MKVLVVEDNEDSRNLLVKVVRAYGHEVMAAANGAEALEQALVQPPEIIVSDILMPKMDGYQLCREWKQNDKLKDIPFVFYTATYTREEDEKFALSLGADAFLIKPTEPDTFVQTLSEVFEKAKAGALAPAKVASLEPSLFLTEYAKRIFAKLKDKVAQLEIEITQRQQAEEELRESEASLAEAQRIAHLGNWDWDITNNTLRWSDEIYRIFGLKPQQFGATYEAFLNSVHPDDRAFVQKSVDEALYENKLYSIEHRIVLPDGSERVVYEQAEVTFDESGKPTRMVGTVHDITERKKMEEQLIVTDRLASIGELASGIAHELNNPLTSVIGFSELLLDKDVPDDVKEDLEVINREAKRTAGVVRNLLTFARKHETERKLVDIHSIIQKVLELRAYEQKVNNIQVNTRFAPDLPEITADSFQLQQVFLNIIINAEHFMIEAHRGGTLTITTERVGDIIRASFADDGPGIAEENLGHLFDPFFTTKEVGKGTGLGLSICHGIITEHSGRIYAESELGKGATFVVELPISK